MAYLGRGIENLSDRVVLDSLTASATASYTLQLNSVNFVPSSASSLTVSLNGVIQKPDSSYTVSGSTLTFSSALTSSDSIDFIIAERGITLQTPSAGSVNNTSIASNAAIATTKLGAGAVLQIVTSQNDTTSRETTSTSYVTAGTTATITPSSTSSKIFVLISWNEDVNNTNTIHFVTVYRGSTNIGSGSDVSFGRFHDVSAGRALIHTSSHKIDEPSTTSSTTYTLYHKVGAGTGRVRNDLVPATLTLMEIAG